MTGSFAPAAALLLVPIVTGLTSVLWSPIAARSWVAMAALNALSYVVVWAGVSIARPSDPRLVDVAGQVGWPVIVGYVAGSVAVSLLWFCAHERTGVVWIAFTETGWGFAALLFTVLLCRIPGSVIRPLEIAPMHVIGGALIVLGAWILAAAERGTPTHAVVP